MIVVPTVPSKPPKPRPARRTESVTVKLTKAEKVALRRRAAKAGLSMSAYPRRQLTKGSAR